MSAGDERKKITAAIQKKYAEVSETAIGRFTYLTGMAGARLLGYDSEILSALNEDTTRSFCGVGNPFLAGSIKRGESLLDIGCGTGLDLIVAGHYIGPSGRICGIDLTAEMQWTAKENVAKAGLSNVDIQQGNAESLPYTDNSFDIVISNGVLNLSTDKNAAFKEIYRVLAPGGRLQFCDIVLDADKPREAACSLEAWSD